MCLKLAKGAGKVPLFILFCHNHAFPSCVQWGGFHSARAFENSHIFISPSLHEEAPDSVQQRRRFSSSPMRSLSRELQEKKKKKGNIYILAIKVPVYTGCRRRCNINKETLTSVEMYMYLSDMYCSSVLHPTPFCVWLTCIKFHWGGGGFKDFSASVLYMMGI